MDIFRFHYFIVYKKFYTGFYVKTRGVKENFLENEPMTIKINTVSSNTICSKIECFDSHLTIHFAIR